MAPSYTGATTDVDRRFAEHQQAGPKAARYLKGRGPLQLILTVHAGGHKAALKLERRIKGLPKARKEVLIQNPESMQEIFGVLRRFGTSKVNGYIKTNPRSS